MNPPVDVLICDDHPIVREALRTWLSETGGIRVVGEAADGNQVIDRVRQLKPDLVLIDIEMPGLDGISATRRMIGLWPDLRVLMFTAHDRADVASEAAAAGAAGFLLKAASAEEMREAVLTVNSGGSWFPRRAVPDREDELTRLHRLTRREREILVLLADGLRAKGVAAELGISPATVYTHVRNAVAKLEVETRSQAVAIATRYDFISPPPDSGRKSSATPLMQ